ncbi:MAG: hypothetical protein ACRDQ1_05625, partial [Sciscionella sp.]
GLPWREFRYAQLGETHGGGKWWWPPATAAQLSGKILRIVGAQQQWLVPVADEHQANTYLALLIGRAEQALGDCAEGAATEQAPDVVAKRAAKARRGVAIGRSAMNAGGTPGFHGVWTLAAVAIACLPIALISFVPQVMNFVAPRGNHAVTNWPAGAIFGIIGIVALVQYVRYRRGLTYLVNHPFSAEHTHWGELDPTAMPALNTGSGQLGTAGLADWTALGPAIYPRNLPDTDVGGVRYSSVAAVRGVEGTAAR